MGSTSIRLQLNEKVHVRTSRSNTMDYLRAVSSLLILLSHNDVIVTGFMYTPKNIPSRVINTKRRSFCAAILPNKAYSTTLVRTRATTSPSVLYSISNLGWDNENFLESLGKGSDAINEANEEYQRLSRFGRRGNNDDDDNDDIPGESMLSPEKIEQIKKQNEQIQSTASADGGEMYKNLLERAEQQKKMQPPPPQGLPDNFSSLNVEQQAALFRELMFNQNNPMGPQPPGQSPVDSKGSKDGRRLGRNRDADAIVNTSDVYLAQLKIDSASRLKARNSGDDNKANEVFGDPRIQDIKLHVNPYMEEQKRLERELYGGDVVEFVPSSAFGKVDNTVQPSYAGIKYKDKLKQKILSKGNAPASTQSGPSTSISKGGVSSESGTETIATNYQSNVVPTASNASKKPVDDNPLADNMPDIPFTTRFDNIQNDPPKQMTNVDSRSVIPKQQQPVSHYDQWSYKSFTTPNSNTKTDYTPNVVGNIPDPPKPKSRFDIPDEVWTAGDTKTKPKSHYDQWSNSKFDQAVPSDLKANNFIKNSSGEKSKSHYDQWSDSKFDQAVPSDLKANTIKNTSSEKQKSHYDQWSDRKLHIPEQMDLKQSSSPTKPVSHWDQWANKPFQTPIDENAFKSNVVRNLDPLGPRVIGVDEGMMLNSGYSSGSTSERPPQAQSHYDQWQQRSFETPNVEEFRGPTLPTSSSSSFSASYRLPTGEDGIRNDLRTLMGLILKHKGGPGFGLGRLQGREIERFMHVSETVLDALSEEVGMVSAPSMPEREYYQSYQGNEYQEPYENAVAMSSTSISERLDKMIACIEGAIQMYKYSPPELQDGVLMTLRAALLSAVNICNDIIQDSSTSAMQSPSSSISTSDRLKNMIGVLEGAIQMYKYSPPELQKSVIFTIRTALLSTINTCEEMMAGGSYDNVNMETYPASQPPPGPPLAQEMRQSPDVSRYQQQTPQYPDISDPDSLEDTAARASAIGGMSSIPPPDGNDPNSQFFQGVYNRLKTASGNGKLGFKENIALKEAEELVDDINEMRKLLVQEVENGIPPAAPATSASEELSQLSSSALKYSEMLAKAKANKENGFQ